MDYASITKSFEKEIEQLFSEVHSGIAEREDSRAFGAMIEKRITDNWSDICKKLRIRSISNPWPENYFRFCM